LSNKSKLTKCQRKREKKLQRKLEKQNFKKLNKSSKQNRLRFKKKIFLISLIIILILGGIGTGIYFLFIKKKSTNYNKTNYY
jgi:flagellar basal body-associated protein FliL